VIYLDKDVLEVDHGEVGRFGRALVGMSGEVGLREQEWRVAILFIDLEVGKAELVEACLELECEE
jgi:hypothetical protein